MAQRSPAMTQRLVQIAQAAASAPHGTKEVVYAAACAELAVSRATLLRGINEVTIKPQRKQRSDAGDTALTRPEAALISAYVMEGIRKNNKRNISIPQALNTLRRNGEIRAEFCDADGVLRPLSASAVARALRAYKLHPDQLLRPAPAVEMRSLHPNHVWEIDASICILFYLNTNNPKEQGLRVMRAAEFEKNKPKNLAKIERDRVWRYVCTDHYSGTVQVHYVFGAESAVNLAESFIRFIQPKPGQPIHGVPYMLYMDKGSANTSGTFKNLARRLGVELEAHAAENARATGQVEKAQDLVERGFESGLRMCPVRNIDELNALAQRWMSHFNGHEIHSRTRQTRYAVWQHIGQEQLRLAPSTDMCRLLLTHAPESRKVTDTLRVEFAGKSWDVSGVPAVMVGEKLNITFNPYDMNQVFVVEVGEDGHETLYPAPLVDLADDVARFSSAANVFGESYARPADTVADQHRKELELLATGAATQDEAATARKTKGFVPFDGRINPYAGQDEQTQSVAYMPKPGTNLPTQTTVVPPAPTSAPRLVMPALPVRTLSQFEAAQELRAKGMTLTSELVATLRSSYPNGVPEDEIDALHARLTVRAGLKVVNGSGT